MSITVAAIENKSSHDLQYAAYGTSATKSGSSIGLFPSNVIAVAAGDTATQKCYATSAKPNCKLLVWDASAVAKDPMDSGIVIDGSTGKMLDDSHGTGKEYSLTWDSSSSTLTVENSTFWKRHKTTILIVGGSVSIALLLIIALIAIIVRKGSRR